MNCPYSLVFLSFLLQTSFSIPESFPWLSPSHETLPVVVTFANIAIFTISSLLQPISLLIQRVLVWEVKFVSCSAWKWYCYIIWDYYDIKELASPRLQSATNHTHSLTTDATVYIDIQCLSIVPRPLLVTSRKTGGWKTGSGRLPMSVNSTT